MQTFGPAAVAAVGRRVERPTDRRATRALGTVRSAYPPGVSKARDALGGPGPRAPCARCVPRPARKARRAGDARLRAATSLPPQLPGTLSARGRERAELGSGERGGPTGGPWPLAGQRPRGPAGRDACWYWRLCRVEKIIRRPGRCCLLDPGRSPTHEDLKEKKEVVEEAENGRDAPANGNANEENGEQEADNEVDEEEEEGGEEEEEEEEGDGEEEDGDEDEEAESATGKRAAEDDEDDDVDTKKQKTDEDD
ncbi:prothymosin alpha isoform X2 [Papio anubis]|uniref:prothymosin alpha isoform X2 n=1 Tax=Papio anubis TaxID=9555 RepID=UPI0012AD57B6|nr:prothymosin alpha isoform X2 [Papio anubis]